MRLLERSSNSVPKNFENSRAVSRSRLAGKLRVAVWKHADQG